MRLFCKLSSSGSSDPYHFEGTRSVLSWETIVHYPRYKLRGQIRLKDTTLSLGSDQHSHLFVFVLLLQVCFFCFWFLNDYRNNKFLVEVDAWRISEQLVDQTACHIHSAILNLLVSNFITAKTRKSVKQQ